MMGSTDCNMQDTVTTMHEQGKRAFELIDNGCPFIFVSGEAGTGKSVWIKECVRKYGNMPVISTTGLAALNVNGITVHSLFRVPPRIATSVTPKPLDHLSRVKRILFDEISTLRADILDFVDQTLQLSKNNQLPFGGVQVIVVGDNFQLPPVVTEQDSDAFNMVYSSPWWFDAKVMQNVEISLVRFTQVFRQADPLFKDILQQIRIGAHTPELIDGINQICMDNQATEQHVHVCATRAVAKAHNTKQMNMLPGNVTIYTGTRTEGFTIPDDQLPSPLQLELKKGARVMVTKTVGELGLVNGTIGKIRELHERSVTIETDDGSPVVVPRCSWDQYRYTKNGDSLSASVAGSYFQIPLALAWASTVHKLQGQTLDKIVVNLGNGAFAPGQTYVALSRCRSLEGLVLARPLRVRDAWCDRRAKMVEDMLIPS